MSLDQSLKKILIIDFGSQFTQLIARRIREFGVFCEIVNQEPAGGRTAEKQPPAMKRCLSFLVSSDDQQASLRKKRQRNIC